MFIVSCFNNCIAYLIGFFERSRNTQKLNCTAIYRFESPGLIDGATESRRSEFEHLVNTLWDTYIKTK